MTRRAGHTLAELIVAMPLGALLLAVLLATIIAQARLARALTARLGRVETERLAYGVLRHELRWAHSGDAAAASDSLALRLLRGMALTCGDPAADAVVDYFGLREPNPAKDSVLLVSSGGEAAVALLGSSSTTSACAAPAARSMRLARPAERGVLLLFENGSYYLSARALRFRSGAEGRQPLTEEWLEDAGTHLLAGPLPIGVRLRLQDAPAHTWRWALPNAITP